MLTSEEVENSNLDRIKHMNKHMPYGVIAYFCGIRGKVFTVCYSRRIDCSRRIDVLLLYSQMARYNAATVENFYSVWKARKQLAGSAFERINRPVALLCIGAPASPESAARVKELLPAIIGLITKTTASRPAFRRL